MINFSSFCRYFMSEHYILYEISVMHIYCYPTIYNYYLNNIYINNYSFSYMNIFLFISVENSV